VALVPNLQDDKINQQKLTHMKRSSSVTWHGSGKEGSGKISTQSKTLASVPYSYSTRFGEEKGVNPEELIAAAHASCYTMKLSFVLGAAGHEPEVIKTTCTVLMEDSVITESHLEVGAKVPGITGAQFEQYAEEAKKTCPVSKALSINITLTAHLTDETVEQNEKQKTEV
jgi:lipoyl-dependent peroxiredoxin